MSEMNALEDIADQLCQVWQLRAMFL